MGDMNPRPEWSRDVRRRKETRGLKRIKYFEPVLEESQGEPDLEDHAEAHVVGHAVERDDGPGELSRTCCQL